jgi:hypothetical protein
MMQNASEGHFDKTAFVTFMISNTLNNTLMKHIQTTKNP